MSDVHEMFDIRLQMYIDKNETLKIMRRVDNLF